MLRFTVLWVLVALVNYEEEAKRLEEKGREAKNGLQKLEVGDGYTRLLGKYPKSRQQALDAASGWYAKAWPELAEVYKISLRERLRILYAPRVPSRGKLPKGWSGKGFSIGSARVHSGGAALRVVLNGREGVLSALGGATQPIPAGKSFEFSVWVSSEETSGISDKIQVELLDAQRKPVWVKECFIPPDMPVWVRLGDQTEFPEGAMVLKVHILADSPKGILWIDDISAKVDGKELIALGFE